MATLRLLLALLLMAVGTTAGAFAISGYFEPHMVHGQPVAGPASAPPPVPQLTIGQPRKRFLATDDKSTRGVREPAAAEAAQPKTVTAPARKKPAPKDAHKDKPRPQQAAASWNWGLFGN